MTPLDAALQWNSLGIAAIPIKYRDKRPVFGWKQYQKELPKKEDLHQWFKSKFNNVAVITGHQNLVIIDFDNEAIWQLWESWINLKMPKLLPSTYRVKTRRGQHVYLFVENPPERTLKIKNDKNQTLIDVKAAGGYCLAPPSIHPSGHCYGSLNTPLDIFTVESLDCVMPQNLLEKAVHNDVTIPPYTGQQCNDVWNVTPCIGGDSIQWIKQNRSILEFFPNALPSGGDRWYKVLCPFHDDHNESGWIDVRRNRFGCQNQCVGRGVDIIDFYCLLKNVDRSQAVRELTT